MIFIMIENVFLEAQRHLEIDINSSRYTFLFKTNIIDPQLHTITEQMMI